MSYTNPVLPKNSPDPGALALPDGSGDAKLPVGSSLNIVEQNMGLIVTIVIPRLRIGYNVQFRKKVRRRPRLSSLFLH